jgi:hypothetical protein
VTAQHVLCYNLPGSSTLILSQLNQLAYKPCTSQCTNSAQNGFDPGDYGQPVTYAYNLTIDQRLKWNTVLDVAYVGSSTSQLLNANQGIQGGSLFAALADQNKTPMGAFFKPTRRCAIHQPGNGNNPTGGAGPNRKQGVSYHPYGYAYGTSPRYIKVRLTPTTMLCRWQ